MITYALAFDANGEIFLVVTSETNRQEWNLSRSVWVNGGSVYLRVPRGEMMVQEG